MDVFCISFTFLFLLLFTPASLFLQENAYILYCPCMGRFGNQAEQLLGVLHFAHSLNRTLVLPPFIQYVDREVTFIPFDHIIDIQTLSSHQPVVTMEHFLKDVAPKMWSKSDQKIFCYTSRPGIANDCNALTGNPFKSFWNRVVGVDKFSGGSVFYSPLTVNPVVGDEWNRQYGHIPVLSFVSAPSAYPVDSAAIKLHKYVRISNHTLLKGSLYRKVRKFDHPYIGVHIRHGSDWENACNLLNSQPMRQLFSSAQCFPDKNRDIPYDACIQNQNQIADDIKYAIEKYHIPTVYIATDKDDVHMWQFLYQKLQQDVRDIKIITPSRTYPTEGESSERLPDFIEDIAILSESDHFIGNCISSFSAFVSRTRSRSGKTTSFFSIKHDTPESNVVGHEEL